MSVVAAVPMMMLLEVVIPAVPRTSPAVTVTVPDPTFSTKYQFKVYFPDHVPTNSYALTLSGFKP